MSFVKNLLKGIFVFVTLITYLFAVLMGALYFIGGLGYKYHSDAVDITAYVFIGASLLLLLTFILSAVMSFRLERGRFLRCCSTLFILVAFILSSVLGTYAFIYNAIVGPNGCSYTENVEHYGKYDETVVVDDHFPKVITDDMTVVKFSYYYKQADIYQIDLYLEVRFENEDIMQRYIDDAIASFGEYGAVRYENPYNPNYTDVLRGNIIWKSNEQDDVISEISFTEYGDIPRVEMYYTGISYSYDELTLIYNYTSIGSDIFVGNDPDNGEYYPKYLEHFGISWNEENNFLYKKSEGTSQ